MQLLIPDKDNLVTYYILPLLDVNKKSFSRVFVQAYINKEGSLVFVEMKGRMTSPNYTLSQYFETDTDMHGKLFAVFSIDEKYKQDVKLFLQGLYSRMSKDAKQKIYNGSSLAYNKKMENFTVTHPVLHCLASTDTMKNFLILHLGVTQLADSGELIDPPEEWWFIENRIKELKSLIQENHDKT